MKQPGKKAKGTTKQDPRPTGAKAARRASTRKKDPTMPSITELLNGAAGGTDKLAGLFLDPKKPPEVRAKMLLDVITSNHPAHQHAVLTAVLQKSTAESANEEAAQLKAQYEQALAELQCGSPRPATFAGVADGEMPGPSPRVCAITYDGHPRYPALTEQVKLENLKVGQTLYLDPQGAVVLGASHKLPSVGPEAAFLRRVPGTDVIEATVQEQRVVLHASEPLLAMIEADEVKRGQGLLFCPRREFAFRAIPRETDHRHRFVDRGKLPDVVAGRDIGKPHWILGWMIKRARILLFREDLHQKFDLRPRIAVLSTLR